MRIQIYNYSGAIYLYSLRQGVSVTHGAISASSDSEAIVKVIEYVRIMKGDAS